MKLANLLAVHERHAEVRWIDASNAEENTPMVAVNEDLGFRVRS